MAPNSRRFRYFRSKKRNSCDYLRKNETYHGKTTSEKVASVVLSRLVGSISFSFFFYLDTNAVHTTEKRKKTRIQITYQVIRTSIDLVCSPLCPARCRKVFYFHASKIITKNPYTSINGGNSAVFNVQLHVDRKHNHIGKQSVIVLRTAKKIRSRKRGKSRKSNNKNHTYIH